MAPTKPPLSNAAPNSDTPANTNTARSGFLRGIHHSTKGVNTTHRLIRNAALLAWVSATPKVSQMKMHSVSRPSTG